MSYQLEVCVDNLESLLNAIEAGATRIELCSSLSLGGLTPSLGLMKQASRLSSIPIYAMIRPRQGDFLFNEHELECMLEDIEAAKEAGLDGIVIGALTPDGHIDKNICKQLMAAADRMSVTFHRAIDQCCDVVQALQDIQELGCQRILTSGQASNALSGVSTIKLMKEHAGESISIMVGAGVTPSNVTQIMAETGVSEVHLSGKTTRPSHMLYVSEQAKMGNSDIDDFSIPVTDMATICSVAQQLELF
ncbi:copper homeostasis protein CutC [Vibrio sp. S9_S30]|uniref:copper homeostasis protein CutC n=1 Tax=Vibrio sp. S9_S30 TaxID=2720226 RepID=UPI0016812117|nr:copper homeostasis protein CutC [Vibrio sp. S9_S30]MBD1555751.1 copper homeostasis protein CutC [Vibrio sp. S9_S30]